MAEVQEGESLQKNESGKSGNQTAVTAQTAARQPGGTGTSTSHYLALYRKYRPQTFDDVVGRDAIVRTLKNQIVSGRIGHSYLFCGTRGTGKTTIAKIFARAVNCEHPHDGNPCGECATCRAIAENADLNVVEMDAASNNSVDDIRQIIDQVAYSPTQGRYRVYIIDEVHMLSTQAFNALLKTLEEPPSYAIFILATTEPNKLPLTILSRCQRYNFGRIPIPIIEGRLQTVCEREGLHVEEQALRYIASAADGSVRDGLSILDQCNAFNYGSEILTYDKVLEILGAVDASVFSHLFNDIHTGSTVKALSVLDTILNQGRELVQFVTDYIGYLRNVMLLKASEDTAASLDVSSDKLEMMLDDARKSELDEVVRSIDTFSSLAEQIRYSSNRRILTEAAIIRLCNPAMDVARTPVDAVKSLQERVRVLEEKITEDELLFASGSFVHPQRAQENSAAAGNELNAAQSGQQGPYSGDVLSRAAGMAAGEGGTAPGANRMAAGGHGTAPGADRMAAGEGGTASGMYRMSQSSPPSRPPLPAAVPEDIRLAASRWDQLVAALPKEQHLMKIYLRNAHPTASEDGQLQLVFSNYVYCDFFTGKGKEDNRRFFEDYLAQQTGRKLPVVYKALDKEQKFSDNYVDLRKIEQNVTMPISEEED